MSGEAYFSSLSRERNGVTPLDSHNKPVTAIIILVG